MHSKKKYAGESKPLCISSVVYASRCRISQDVDKSKMCAETPILENNAADRAGAEERTRVNLYRRSSWSFFIPEHISLLLWRARIWLRKPRSAPRQQTRKAGA